jgi:hypothetical protein
MSSAVALVGRLGVTVGLVMLGEVSLSTSLFECFYYYLYLYYLLIL